MKLIKKYIGQEERLVNICFNLFEKNCTDSNNNDNAVSARRVLDEIGIAISLTLEEQVINGSNFYSQLGLIDMKSGSFEDIVSTIFALDFYPYDKHIGIENSSGRRLTIYDEAVYNALSLLWLVGHEDGKENNEYITPRMIFQVLSMNFSQDINNDCSEKSKEDIINSLDALRETDLFIDVPDPDKEGAYKYSGSLLPSEWELEKRINSKDKVKSIHLLRFPPLYDYAMKTGHIFTVSVPESMKSASEIGRAQVNSNKKEIILIREYLSVLILISRKQGDSSCFVEMKKLYEIFGVPSTSYKQQSDVRKRVKRSLEDLEKFMCIKSYSEQKQGAQVLGYKVEI